MRTRTGRLVRTTAVFVCLLAPTVLLAQTITVLHVNDSHSHLEAFGPKQSDLSGTIGGLSKAATVIGGIRQVVPNTLFVHAGDFSHGDLFFNRYFGVPELQLLRGLGLDAMTVGNHEFDFGSGFLASVLASAGPLPLLSANLTIPEGHPLASAIRRHLVRNVAGVKVGIFGLTTPSDPMANPAPLVLRSDIAVVAAAEVSALRAEGASVVIALSHLGSPADKALAAAVSGIDFIVGGHDHLALRQPITVTAPDGNPVRIVQAGEFYENVGVLRFTVKRGQIRFGGAGLVPINKYVPEAPEVQAVVDSLKPGVVARYGDVFGTVIAEAAGDVPKTYDPRCSKRDTAMGNLVADALRARTGTDLGITVTGLVSEGLYAGPLVGADIFRPVSYGYDPPSGFGFKVATLEIRGLELIKAMETCLSFAGLTDTFDLQVSGMSFQYDSRRGVGQRLLLESLRIQDQPIDPAALYSMTVNQGIAMLLPSMGVTVENVVLLPDLEYIVLRDFIAGLGTVAYASEGRIRDVAALR
jgi:2',3'-cyclic-nucleotide 2'-phosphodiesterase (5'-nucleotidase family)